MSTTIDEKVVEMRFDNKHFETHTRETMSTLDKLKEKLNLTGASKGLENINSSANKIDMSGLGNAVEIVRSKFSALEVMGITALANITNSAVNAGKRIASALTIQPIMTGFSEYETKINAIQTIMSNTASKGTTMDDVTKTLNELNTYADKTIYNFAEMTRNIGTFTAAGVGLEESASAIQGIANLAAASGSTSQQASTAMYQLSQALASGSVKLMDWNSVVNAGMGGQKFQEALKATAKEHGVAVDAIIKKSGSFRESLKEEWITADILNETLSKFTVDGAKKYADAMMESGKWTQEQADALMKEAQSMEDAATKVKTFTQLWDTLKESAQSGWAQSWEILVGNFEEAKELLTEISDVIGGVLTKSAESRNKVLQEWKDLGGRTAIVDSIRNTFEAIGSVVTPIKEAFSEIFPPITAKQLLDFSNGIKDLTSKLILSDETAAKLKSTFKGAFAVIDIGVTFIKDIVGGLGKLISNFTGITGGILGATGSLGDWLINVRDSIKETDVLGKAVDFVVDKIQLLINSVKNFFDPKFEGFLGVFKGLFEFISNLGLNIGKALGNSFREGDFVEAINVFNTGVLGSILLGFNKFVNNLSGPIENISDILGSLKGVLETYQQDLQANTLLKIAKAVGILAASLIVLSMIKPENLGSAISAISVLFAELLGSLAIFKKIAPTMKGTFSAVTAMIGISSSLLILSAALKVISTINWDDLKTSLLGMGLALAEIFGFMWVMGKAKVGSISGFMGIATSLVILGGALKILSTMSWDDIWRSLTVMGLALVELVAFAGLMKLFKASNPAGMIGMTTSLVILGGALKILSTMSWDDIKRSLTVLGLTLAELVAFSGLMKLFKVSIPSGMIGMVTSLVILGGALKILATMNWEDIQRSLTVLGGALFEIFAFVGLMKLIKGDTFAGSMVAIAGSLVILGVALKILGSIGVEKMTVALGGLAITFGILGLAAILLTPLVPTILALSKALAILGVSTLAIGIGLGLMGAGITALSVALTAGVTSIVAGLSAIILGIAGLIPELIKIFGESIVVFCQVIIECAPLIAETILVVVDEVLKSLANHAPSIVVSLMQFLIGILNGIADNLPALIVAAVRVIGSFFQGVVDALGQIDVNTLLQGIAGVGLLTGLMLALGVLAGMVPSAMAGVLGLGLLITELALVLAAVGAFSQIPGLSWLIEEGGNFLQKIGTAIGQFIGGIAGGIMQGVTSSFPQMGKDLSDFMTNLQPFINGAKMIDASVADGVKSLADVILTLTAANILDGLTSWFTGGTSLADFGKQLAEFGPYMAKYASSVAGINSETVVASANAAKALSEMANNLPNSGGVIGWFAGENDMTTFGDQLVTFGTKLKEYSLAVVGIDSEAINASVTATKALSEMASAIPNMGGVVGFFTGNNDIDTFGKKLADFGKSLKKYSEEVSGVDSNALSNSTAQFTKLVDMAKGMSGVDFEGIGNFANSLENIGKNSINKFVETFENGSRKAAEAFKKIVEAIKKAYESKSDDFKKIGTKSIEKYSDGIKESSKKAEGAFKSVISSVLNIIQSAGTAFFNSGDYVVRGFASGISANTFKAEAAARVMAEHALEAARAALREHSPSKAFYDVGDYAGLGFVNALDDYGSVAYNSGYGMAEMAKNGLSKAIARVTDVIENGMDTQPTIRPILDLSDVESGVGSIGSMFNNGPSIGVMSNLSAISSGMNNRNQNGTTNDVISAINKLRKDLGNTSGDTYNINGITYDDGSNVSNAVKDLIRAAKVERRI